jgi:hypothetical protein
VQGYGTSSGGVLPTFCRLVLARRSEGVIQSDLRGVKRMEAAAFVAANFPLMLKPSTMPVEIVSRARNQLRMKRKSG